MTLWFWRENTILSFWRKTWFWWKTWFCGFDEEKQFFGFEKKNMILWFRRKTWVYGFDEKTRLCSFGENMILRFWWRKCNFNRKLWFYRFDWENEILTGRYDFRVWWKLDFVILVKKKWNYNIFTNFLNLEILPIWATHFPYDSTRFCSMSTIRLCLFELI